LKKAANLAKGSQTPGRGFVGKVTWSQLKDIAAKKMVDLNANDIDAAAQMIAGSARSMGLEVVEG
jgi:large subunit ribosomal protein L11